MKVILKVKEINIIIKMITLVYICILSVNIIESNFIVAILLLIYLISSFLREVVYNKFTFVFSIIEVVVSLILAIKYINMAALLASITVVYYFFIEFKNKLFLTAILGGVPLVFILEGSELRDSVYVYILIFIVFLVHLKMSNKILALEEKEEEQRKRIYRLQNKLKEEESLREQFLYTAKLEERNKISGNLHDKIGHTISGTILQLEAIKVIFNKDEKKAKESLDLAIKNLRVGMDDIRMTLKNIRPQQEELGINRIKLILEEKTKNTKYNFKIKYNGDLESISVMVWILFIEAVKEISTNSIKYSKGDLIEVKLEVLNAIIKLEVKDNGVGEKNIKKGMGLSNLEDKVAERNGKVIINGDNGFSVIILMPFK